MQRNCETNDLYALSPGLPPCLVHWNSNLGICPCGPTPAPLSASAIHSCGIFFMTSAFSLSLSSGFCSCPFIPVLSDLSDVTEITAMKFLIPCLVQGRCSVRIFLLLKVAQICYYASRGSEQKAFIKLGNKSNLCCFLVKDVSLRQNSKLDAWIVSGSTTGSSPSLSL